MGELPHRDIFSGIVANEIAKTGAFGKEIDAFGYYYWNPFAGSAENQGIAAAIHEDEKSCVSEMVARVFRGELVSDVVACRERVFEDGELKAEDREIAIRNKVLERLEINVKAGFEETVAGFCDSAGTGDVRDERFESYIANCGKCDDLFIDGMLSVGLRRGLISVACFKKNQRNAVLPSDERAFSGFVYRDNGVTKCYANAYLATTFKKWQLTKGASPLAFESPVGNGAPVQRKVAFEQLLQKRYDEAFFELVE